MRKKTNFTVNFSVFIVFGATLTPALAELSSNLALEEIMVTAQKRSESLQDVPIAISAVSGENMRSNGVMKLEHIAPSIPNLHIGEAFATDSMFIRGVGSGINFGFEQAVGQVVDGFFYGRSRFGRVAFLDIERVEVLKGPQGALIGKNTSGGAINITTAKPTDEFFGWVSAGYETMADKGYTVEGVVSGALSDSVKARFAIRTDNRDGYIENTFTGKDDPNVNDTVARLITLWEPTDDMDITVSYSHGEMTHEGRNVEISKCGQSYRDRLAAAGLGALENCKVDFKHSSDARRPAIGPGTFETQDTQFDITNLTLNTETGLGTFSSLTGYANYDYIDEQDGERGPLSERALDFAEDYTQWSQEFRLTSFGDSAINYITGLFYQNIDHETLLAVHLYGPSTSINLLADQNTETYAAFGQVTWSINENIDITLGARYTKEEKDVNLIQDPTVLFDRTTPTSATGFVSHDVTKKRDESNFSPTLNVTWRPSDDTMMYASVRKGFKGGGFDHWLQGDQASAESLGEFEEEKVTHYELGAKLTLADGAAQLNTALFRSEFDGLQTSNLIDATTAAFAVGNAATAITQGIESDLKWRITESLTLTAMGAYLDASYDDYTNAPCYRGQSAAEGCINNLQDLSGESLQYAPDLSASLSVEYTWFFASGLSLIGNVEVVHSDEFVTDTDNDPDLYQDSYQKYNARLTLADEATITRGTDLPTTTDGESFFVLVEAPMSLTVQGRYRF
jgi:iron complex outermembrane recepter protein